MQTPYSHAEVLAIEHAAARAWPPGQSETVDGWLVRTSGGSGRRANSVLPLAFTGHDTDAAIEIVEALYRARGLRCYFQVSSHSAPIGLDALLATRGYTYEEPTLLMAKRLAATRMPEGVEILAEPSAEWMAIYTAPLQGQRAAEVPAILTRVPAPRALFLVRREGVSLATALAVLSPDGTVMVECVATLSARRRTGAAGIAMDALEAWAAERGATTAALQVVASNAPARALYDGRDYEIASRYHYRWKQV